MSKTTRLLLASSITSLACQQPAPHEELPEAPPNILLIVADDLGFSDISPFGGELRTPALDRLAGEGLSFSNFHVLPTCSPTRSALLTGNDNHVAGVGIMSEVSYPAVADLPGYQGHLTDGVATIPEVLRAAGYHTYMAGKWHLGEADDQSPFTRGFERTFALMNGGGSHYADMQPISPLEPLVYRRDGERVTELPTDFYSTAYYTDAVIDFIERDRPDGRPFFAYLSYTAPHDPLHAPAEYIARYEGAFDDGWDAVRLARRDNLRELGLIPADLEEMSENPLARPWGSLSPEEQRLAARDMEVYAAMVDYMDMSIGRLLDYLKANELYDDTLILFCSDNGANGAPATAYPGNADGTFLGGFDNSLENRGLSGSFVDMGAGWAQASSSPSRLYKSFTTEGGIRSPLIVRFPGDNPRAGDWSHALLHVTDVMPTLLELAGVPFPETLDGRAVAPPVGASLLPIARGELEEVHVDDGIGYELFEMKAYIEGRWKILRLPEPFGDGSWALYDLAEDPGELHDLSGFYPERKAQLVDAWNRYAAANDVVDHAGHFDAFYRKAYGVGD